MFSSRCLVVGSIFVAGALSSAPIFASAPAKSLLRYPAQISPQGWSLQFTDEKLESRWSFRGHFRSAKTGTLRVVFGWQDAKNFALLKIESAQNQSLASVFQVKEGRVIAASSSGVLLGASGTLVLQKVGNRVRALSDGVVVAQTTLSAELSKAGTQLGWMTLGNFKLEDADLQPTEAVVFRDDFMRAQGPDDKEIPGEWKTAGLWKTSGSLGPKSDAALNPNPFVFRAQGAQESVARAGKWWWSDYSVSASVRANQNDEKAPLRAGLEAFSGENGAGIRGEVDFSRGLAVLKNGAQVLAQSAPFEVEPNGWHRLRLQPGPGVAQLWVDGILRVSAPSQRAQGAISLRGVAGGQNSVDFDDVRVGALSDNAMSGGEWGEGALPARFQKDRLMRNWASESSAWKRDKSGIWWHTGDFFGAAHLSMTLPKLEVGQGFELLLAADPAHSGSGVRVELVRPAVAEEVVAKMTGSAQNEPLKMPDLAALPLQIQLSVGQKGQLSVTGTLDGRNLGVYSALPGSSRGTKIGIRPLKNGQPLPPPQLQPLSISSSTFEREGRAVVGVNITPVSLEIAREIGLSDAAGAVVDNVEALSPAQAAGLREGDIIRGIDGARVTDVDSMRAAVGAVKPGVALRLEILRPQANDAGLDLVQCQISTPDVLDYSFTAAPVDWRAASGIWDVSERWTCSPQWSFFGGRADISPVLWSRFATQGDFTLEAYLATPMDLTRSERSPSDLNLSVGADGTDLASGYSFIFGGKNRSVNQIRRGDAIASEKPFEMPAGAGDTHQDWFYVRLERRQTAAGVRFRYSVNGRELANYLDPKPLPDNGHIAFWTQNGGLSIARVRLWHAGMRVPQTPPLSSSASPLLNAPQKLENGLGFWSARGAGRDASAQIVLASQTSGITGTGIAGTGITGNRAPKNGPATVKIVNPRSGGDWATYVTRTPFKPNFAPTLEWDYCVPNSVKVNLYALIDSVWREIVFTGGAASSDDSSSAPLSAVTGVITDGKWHHARFDLWSALRSKGISADSIDALAFAAPAHDYLRSGLGGNHRGATYWLRDFKATQPTN